QTHLGKDLPDEIGVEIGVPVAHVRPSVFSAGPSSGRWTDCWAGFPSPPRASGAPRLRVQGRGESEREARSGSETARSRKSSNWTSAALRDRRTSERSPVSSH